MTRLTRLTRALESRILKCLKHELDNTTMRNALKNRLKTESDEIMRLILGEDKVWMDKLPDNYFAHRKSISVKLPRKVNGKVKPVYVNLVFTTATRVPAYVNNTYRYDLSDRVTEAQCRAVFKADNELATNINDCHALVESTRAKLSGFNTVKALLEAWPECEKYIPDSEPNVKAMGVKFDQVNADIRKLSV